MSRAPPRRHPMRAASVALVALILLMLLPAAAAAGPERRPVHRTLSYPGDVQSDGFKSVTSSILEHSRDNAIREALRRAALDVGVAFWVTDLKHEPNLDGLSVSYRPPLRDVGEAGASALSRLVRLASRRQLVAADAWQQHATSLLIRDLGCSVGLGPQQCLAPLLRLVPSFEPVADGALEMVADSRTQDTAVSAFDYLNAAFEIDVWRPAGVHPMLARAARNAAAVMRVRTASHRYPCGVTALWVVAAVTADIPGITRIGVGEWHRADRVVELRSVTRNAAVRGCRASAALADRYDQLGVRPPAWPFWERHLAEAMSDATAAGIADTLDRMTAGSLRSVFRPPLADDVPALTPYRACDQQSPVLPFSETVLVARFRVAPCLADSLRALLDAASADGIVLRGWGWRSTLTQIRLRRQYCPLPPPSSDRYWLQLSLMESRECTPPVSKPRTSMHESGRAVDFTCGTNGTSMRPGVSCYEWLTANAHHYGLYNFVPEPWHWSTEGR